MIRFVEDVGITYGKGEMTIAELWGMLEGWYVSEGILEITYDKGNKKLTWQDVGTTYDPVVKAQNKITSRLLQLFPKARTARSADGKQRVIKGIAKNLKESSKLLSVLSEKPLKAISDKDYKPDQSTVRVPSSTVRSDQVPSDKMPSNPDTVSDRSQFSDSTLGISDGSLTVIDSSFEGSNTLPREDLTAISDSTDSSFELSFRKNDHDQPTLFPNPERSPTPYELEDGDQDEF